MCIFMLCLTLPNSLQKDFVNLQELELEPRGINVPQRTHSVYGEPPRTSAHTENFGHLQDLESSRTWSSRVSPDNPKQTALDIPKKKRSAFSKEVKLRLNSWYQECRDLDQKKMNAYISETGLTKKQLEDWFTNRRKRDPSRDQKPTLSHSSARHTFSTQSSGAATATSEHFEVSPGSTPASVSRDYQGLSQDRSQQECLFSKRCSPQLRQYRDMDYGAEPVLYGTAENLSQDDQGLRFFRKDFNSGLTTLNVAQGVRAYDVSTTSSTTIFSDTRSANERQSHRAPENFHGAPRPRRKGQRTFAKYYSPTRVAGKRFQCRHCNKGFGTSQSWIRHEQNSCGPPQERCVCMEGGPRLYDALGQAQCAFCGERNPSGNHLNDEHQYLQCWSKPVEQREFNRRDSLIRHYRTVHKATQELPSSWVRPTEEALHEQQWCGFCPVWVRTRETYYSHVEDHFNDEEQVFDMTRWIPEPRDFNMG